MATSGVFVAWPGAFFACHRCFREHRAANVQGKYHIGTFAIDLLFFTAHLKICQAKAEAQKC